MISHNAQAIQLEQKFNRSLGIWSQRSNVAETGNLIDTAPPYVTKDGSESYIVTVNVGQQCDPHCFLNPSYRISRRFQQIVADAPFVTRGVAEQACGGEEEPAPAPHPECGVGAIDRAQDLGNRIAM